MAASPTTAATATEGSGLSPRPRRPAIFSISPKDAAFRQCLIDNGIYPTDYQNPHGDQIPENLSEVLQRLQCQRSSLSTSQFNQDDFKHFKDARIAGTTEAAVMSNIFPTIRGKETIPSDQNVPFNHLEYIGYVADPKPDYFNGVRPEQIRLTVRQDIGQYILPCNDMSRPALPSFFLEVKGTKDHIEESELQVTQDLAYAMRGIHKIRSYRQQPVYDNKAYAFGATFHAAESTLHLYAMHMTKTTAGDSAGRAEFHTTKLRSYFLGQSVDDCRQGITAWRNLKDLAKEYRDRFVAAANEAAGGDGESVNSVKSEPVPTDSEGTTSNGNGLGRVICGFL
jgi:hypothetical protein